MRTRAVTKEIAAGIALLSQQAEARLYPMYRSTRSCLAPDVLDCDMGMHVEDVDFR